MSKCFFVKNIGQTPYTYILDVLPGVADTSRRAFAVDPMQVLIRTGNLATSKS